MKRLKTTPISELAELENPIAQLQNMFIWDITIKDKEGVESVVSVWDNITWRHFLNTFYDWSYVWVDVGEIDFYKAFGLLVTDFKKNHEEGLRRTLEAFYRDYNPLENYDKYVDETITDKGTDTSAVSYGKKIYRDASAVNGVVSSLGQGIDSEVTEITESTITQERDVESIIKDKDENELAHISNGALTTSTDEISLINVGASSLANVNGGEVKTINRATTYDKDEKEVNEIEQKGLTSSVSRNRASDKEFNSGADLTTLNKNNTNTRDYHEHGNIGVTTAQQMLQAEYELRMGVNFEDDMLNRFAYECLVLIP